MASSLRRLALVAATAGALLGSVLALPAAATPPKTPSNLPVGIENFQPYVGQTTCDPVAKPGVKAWMNLLLATYPDTSSDGIVRDCGIGGQSEHKEGRAFDWAVSANNPTDVAHVNEVMSWLMATDAHGNKDAMIRRLGIMYMIWNKHIWKAYQADKGWQAYSGESEHTDHVHFSFGWAGANKDTSFWTGKVAPIEDSQPSAPSSPTVTPRATASNLPLLASFGGLTLTATSTGSAVAALQTALQITSTGTWTGDTTDAVEQFHKQQGLAVSTSWTPADWLRLLPKPTVPFGAIEHVDPARGPSLITGWAIDAGDDVPLEIHAYVDGTYSGSTTEDQARPDIAQTYAQYPSAHGYRLAVNLPDGTHQVCTYALNAPNTAGATGKLGCLTVNVQHGPVGAFESLVQTPDGITATGWAVDADTDTPVGIHLLVDNTTTEVLDAAEVARPDLAERFPDYGQGHGFVMPLSLTDGSHKVCAFALNAPNTSGSTSLLGCRTVTVVHGGVGLLDPLGTPPGTVTVSGTALDPDTAAPVDAHVYVDGSFVRSVSASGSRTAPTGYSAWGDDHGFSTSLDLADGTHNVCAYALNAPGTPGANTLLGCQSVAVSHQPIGAQESAVQTADGVVVTGWGLDPDTNASTMVQVLADGTKAAAATANLVRTDVAAAHPQLGAAHGYRALVTGLTAGKHTICTTVVNVARTEGSDVALPCTTVTVVHDPIGIAPVIGRRGNLVTVAGWVIDPDTTDATEAHVYVDGEFAVKAVASLARTDLPLKGYGTGHGYALTADLPAGSHKICVYGINVGTGANALVGCTTYVVKHSPFGNISAVTKRTDGVAVTGWAIDPDTTGGVTVRVSVDGVASKILGAVVSQPNVGAAYPDYGPKHGWSTLLHLKAGKHTICAGADNVKSTPGSSVGLACKTLTV